MGMFDNILLLYCKSNFFKKLVYFVVKEKLKLTLSGGDMLKQCTFGFIPLILLIVVLVPGCVNLPTNPVMPQWNVDLNVPLVNRSYTLDDIIKKQNYISVQPNSQGGIYLIQSDHYNQSVGVSNFIKVTSAATLTNQSVPVVNYDTTVALYLPIPEGAELDSAKFISGSFSFSFSNSNPFSVDFYLSIPGITLPNGSPFTINQTIPSGAKDSLSYNFASDTYRLPSNQQTTNRDKIQLIVSSKPHNSTSLFGLPLTLNFTSSDFYFSQVSGYMPEKSLGVQSDRFSLNIGNVKDYRNKITLQNANLHLHANYVSPANNPFNIEVDSMTIIGMKNDGTVLSTLTDQNGKPFFIFLQNGKLDITFDSSNSNITTFMASLPDIVELRTGYIMNPNNDKTPATVTINDSVKFEADFSTTSYLAIDSASSTDTSSIGSLSNDDRTKIKASQSAYLTVNIQNGIPLNASITLAIADSNYKTLFILSNNTNNSNSFSVAPANVDNNGNVTSMKSSSFTVQLDSSQTDKLSHAYYAIYTVSVSTPGSPLPVALRPTNQIQLQVFGGVNFQVNNDNIK
jgi:hypothetical protein